MNNAGSEADFGTILNEAFNNPVESAVELTSETVEFAPQLGVIIAVGFVLLMLVFVILLVVGIVLKFLIK